MISSFIPSFPPFFHKAMFLLQIPAPLTLHYLRPWLHLHLHLHVNLISHQIFLHPLPPTRKESTAMRIMGTRYHTTDDIEKAFAIQLAQKRLKCALVAHIPEKLKDVSDSISSKHSNTQIKTVVMDFSGDRLRLV